MHRLLIALSFTACTATVRTAGPPPAEPAPPPPAPVVVHDHRTETQPTPPPPPPPSNPPPMSTEAGKHPHYVQALADLRAARGYLMQRPPESHAQKWDEKTAVAEIDGAIKEIKDAAIDDGHAIDEHPPIDAQLKWTDRLDRSIELLLAALKDVNQDEDNKFAKDNRNRAIVHINNALKAVRAGKEEAKHADTGPAPMPPAGHPAYVTALGNLRYARVLLERAGVPGADVKWDEKMAIGEIDAAYTEAKQAHVDDGKPMTEHPPVDSKLVYRDRLREALKLLGDSAKDLEQNEDNAWAKKDRKQAVDHVRRAEKAVQEAIADRKADAKEKAEVKADVKAEKKEEKAEKKAAKGH